MYTDTMGTGICLVGYPTRLCRPTSILHCSSGRKVFSYSTCLMPLQNRISYSIVPDDGQDGIYTCTAFRWILAHPGSRWQAGNPVFPGLKSYQEQTGIIVRQIIVHHSCWISYTCMDIIDMYKIRTSQDWCSYPFRWSFWYTELFPVDEQEDSQTQLSGSIFHWLSAQRQAWRIIRDFLPIPHEFRELEKMGLMKFVHRSGVSTSSICQSVYQKPSVETYYTRKKIFFYK